MFAWWQPLGGVVWNVTDADLRGVLWGCFAFGWLLVLVSTFLINHFDLFGLRQVWLQLMGRPYTHLVFRTPGRTGSCVTRCTSAGCSRSGRRRR